MAEFIVVIERFFCASIFSVKHQGFGDIGGGDVLYPELY